VIELKLELIQITKNSHYRNDKKCPFDSVPLKPGDILPPDKPILD